MTRLAGISSGMCRASCRALLVLAVLSMAPARDAEGATPTPDRRAAYAAADGLRATDPGAAYDAMAEVAAAGDGRALSRLAYYTLRGIGTEADLARAETLYARAAEAGHERSVLSRAKVLMMLGHGAEAARFFDRAVDLGIRGAEAERASAHALARLGETSDPADGWQALQRLARAGDTTAELALLRVGSRLGRRVLPDDAPLLARAADRARNGEGRAAEALLAYLRGPAQDRPGTLALRRELVTHTDVRPAIAAAERLHLAAETEPARFWRAAEEIVAQTPRDARARALVVTAQINRNAYLWVAEPYLAEMGFRLRGERGLLTASRIRALNELCRRAGPAATCAAGPLKSTAIKLTASRIFAPATP